MITYHKKFGFADAAVTSVNTMLQDGDVGIVKIGGKTVKILMK